MTELIGKIAVITGGVSGIAQIALFLASDRLNFVNGQAIMVDGAVANGVLWADQTPAYKTNRPINGYNPDEGCAMEKLTTYSLHRTSKILGKRESNGFG